MSSGISDYSNYDYRKHFWGDNSRRYEHLCESTVVDTFLKSLKQPLHTFVDSGCGFGRLFPAYAPYAHTFYLIDYAQSLLDQAQDVIHHSAVQFKQADILSLPLDSESIDGIMSIRVLHHISDASALFSEYARVLKPGGYFILDIPNKRHLLNVVRGLMAGNLSRYLSLDPIELGPHFYNYHPKKIHQIAHSNQFDIVKEIQSSYFRFPLIKRLFPASFLVAFDRLLQYILPNHWMTPSVYVLYQKK